MLLTPLAAAVAIALTMGELPAAAEVSAASLDVFEQPDEASFATGRVRRGDRVVVRDERDDGWLAIDPPEGSFSLVDREAINETGDGLARLVVPRSPVRAGRIGARLPGAPLGSLRQGDTVELLDQPELTIRQGPTSRTWLAIRPPPGELRYIRAEGVRYLDASDPDDRPDEAPAPPRRSRGPTVRPATRIEPVDRSLSDVGPTPGEGPLPPDLTAALAAVEGSHRSILRRPVEQWDLTPVKQRYQALLDRQDDPAARTALRARLARVGRQESLAKSARAFQEALAKCRQNAVGASHLREPSAESKEPAPLPYDAVGLLQTSSQKIEGQLLFALIGKKGETLAFLNIPPGIEAGTMLARRVGIRGSVRYVESLRARLISVRELDPLGDPP